MHYRFSTINNRKNGEKATVKIGHGPTKEYPDNLINRWQMLLDTVARIYKVPAALIMRLNEDNIEVFLNSQTANNPYEAGEKVKLSFGLYCETAIASRNKLLVPNALNSTVWRDNNPDVDLNMIAYLGYPIFWSDEEVFGTICVLDNKENYYNEDYNDFLEQAKLIIESDLKLIREKEKSEKNEILFRTIFDISPAGIAICNEDGDVLHLNDAFESIDGYPVKDEIGKNFASNIHPDDLEWVSAGMDEIISGKSKSISGELRFVHKNGHTVWARAISSLFPEKINGKKTMISVVQDITKIKEIEEQLKEAISTKEKFISILSHDLGNSFNALLGFSDILLHNFKQLEEQEIEDQIRYIHNVSGKSHSLLEDILSWAKMRSDKVPFHPQKIHLCQTCKEVIEIFISNAKAKNITIVCDGPMGIEVLADENMLRTILRNLITNAIKFTQLNGTITIKTKVLGSEVLITVSDNGIGITEDNIPKLWDISAPRNNMGTDMEQRSGYGLVLCKEFVERHGGKIWVESTPGKGSDFIFTLPQG
jgi:PAS domain S-box-containing protein